MAEATESYWPTEIPDAADPEPVAILNADFRGPENS